MSGIQIQRDRTLNLIITFTSHILSILVVPLSLLRYCCFPTKMTCQLEDQPRWGCKPMKIRPCSTCRAHTHKREASGAGLLPRVYSTGYKGLNWCLYDIMWVNSFRVPIQSLLPRRRGRGFISTGLDHHQLTQYPLVYSSRAGYCFCNGSNLPKVCPSSPNTGSSANPEKLSGSGSYLILRSRVFPLPQKLPKVDPILN